MPFLILFDVKCILVHHLHISQVSYKISRFKYFYLSFLSFLVELSPVAHVFVSNSLRKHFKFVKEKNANVILNCSFKDISPKATSVSSNIFPEFVWAARFDSQKSPQTLLLAWKEYSSRYNASDCPSLHIYGDGPLLSSMRDYATSNNLTSLFFHGFVQDPLAHHPGACFISTSLYEGCSLSLLEALSYSMTIICTNIDPNIEILGNHPYTFLPHDSGALSSLMYHYSLNYPISKVLPLSSNFVSYTTETFSRSWLKLLSKLR